MRAGAWVIAAGVMVVATTAAAQGAVKDAAVRSQTLSTSLTYDAEQRSLTITCAVSSDGLCRITILDGARRKMLSMRPASRVLVRGVSRAARVCALGRSGGACAWRAVSA